MPKKHADPKDKRKERLKTSVVDDPYDGTLSAGELSAENVYRRRISVYCLSRDGLSKHMSLDSGEQKIFSKFPWLKTHVNFSDKDRLEAFHAFIEQRLTSTLERFPFTVSHRQQRDFTTMLLNHFRCSNIFNFLVETWMTAGSNLPAWCEDKTSIAQTPYVEGVMRMLLLGCTTFKSRKTMAVVKLELEICGILAKYPDKGVGQLEAKDNSRLFWLVAHLYESMNAVVSGPGPDDAHKHDQSTGWDSQSLKHLDTNWSRRVLGIVKMDSYFEVARRTVVCTVNLAHQNDLLRAEWTETYKEYSSKLLYLKKQPESKVNCSEKEIITNLLTKTTEDPTFKLLREGGLMPPQPQRTEFGFPDPREGGKVIEQVIKNLEIIYDRVEVFTRMFEPFGDEMLAHIEDEETRASMSICMELIRPPYTKPDESPAAGAPPASEAQPTAESTKDENDTDPSSNGIVDIEKALTDVVCSQLAEDSRQKKLFKRDELRSAVDRAAELFSSSATGLDKVVDEVKRKDVIPKPFEAWLMKKVKAVSKKIREVKAAVDKCMNDFVTGETLKLEKQLTHVQCVLDRSMDLFLTEKSLKVENQLINIQYSVSKSIVLMKTAHAKSEIRLIMDELQSIQVETDKNLDDGATEHKAAVFLALMDRFIPRFVISPGIGTLPMVEEIRKKVSKGGVVVAPEDFAMALSKEQARRLFLSTARDFLPSAMIDRDVECVICLSPFPSQWRNGMGYVTCCPAIGFICGGQCFADLNATKSMVHADNTQHIIRREPAFITLKVRERLGF